jgi:hypothetical protein
MSVNSAAPLPPTGPSRTRGRRLFFAFKAVLERTPNDMSDQMTEELLTPSQAGRELGVSKTRVIQLADEGRLPCTRNIYGRLFPADAVRALAFERAHRSHQAAEAAA